MVKKQSEKEGSTNQVCHPAGWNSLFNKALQGGWNYSMRGFQI